MSRLSPRQRDIVRRLVQGQSQKEVARQLGVSYSTVRAHMRQARTRTDCRTSLELAFKAEKEISKT